MLFRSERVKQRYGIPKRAVQREIDRVLEKGHPPEYYIGAMRRYLDKIKRKTRHMGKFPMIKVHGNRLYVFSQGPPPVLITAWNLPRRFHNSKAKGEYDGNESKDQAGN